MSDFKTWLSGQLAELDMKPTQLASFVPGLNQPTIHRVLNPDKEGGTHVMFDVDISCISKELAEQVFSDKDAVDRFIWLNGLWCGR